MTDLNTPTPFELHFSACGKPFRTMPPEQAIELCMEKAKSGDAQAQFELATFYGTGMMLPRDLAQADHLLKQAVAAEHGPALTALAVKTLYGLDGREVDAEAALGYFQRAMAAGDLQAYESLAKAYYHGQNLLADRRKARELLEAAAELGSQEAPRMLQRFFPNQG